MINWVRDKLADVLSDLKQAHKSWTIWINGTAVAVLEALPWVREVFPELQEYLTPEFYKQAMTVIVIANLILRFKTKSSLKDK